MNGSSNGKGNGGAGAGAAVGEAARAAYYEQYKAGTLDIAEFAALASSLVPNA